MVSADFRVGVCRNLLQAQRPVLSPYEHGRSQSASTLSPPVPSRLCTIPNLQALQHKSHFDEWRRKDFDKWRRRGELLDNFPRTRSIGKLVSPLEPSWLAQTFATKDPSLEDICAANTSWLRAYWRRHTTYTSPLEEFMYPNPDADRWFTLPTLPKTRSSRAIGWCAQAGSQIYPSQRSGTRNVAFLDEKWLESEIT
jgi:hypothetical protein